MSTVNGDWQRQVQQAFDFVSQLYQQAAAMFDDVKKKYADLGWVVGARPGLGGVAYSADVQTTKESAPYVYLKAIVATPADGTLAERVPFVGIVFHHELPRQTGPFAFFGAARISGAAKLNHWALLSVLGMYGDPFKTVVAQDGTRIATSTENARRQYRGVEEVRYREVPLSEIRSPPDVERLVEASLQSVTP